MISTVATAEKKLALQSQDRTVWLTAMIWMLLTFCTFVFAQVPGGGDPLRPGLSDVRKRLTQPATAQPRPSATANPATNNPASPRPTSSSRTKRPTKKDDELKPRLERITTKDGVRLQMGYFPSDKGKEAVPVVFIHEWQGQSSPYKSLASKLQAAGCAVVLLDYRGHGLSKDPSAETRSDNRATKSHMQQIMLDLEAVNSFLKEKNDEEKLNLNALTVVGIREGAILAMNWAVSDWRWPPIGNRKQGQDVKALILVSPVKSVNGINGDSAIKDQNVNKLPIMIVSGSKVSENSEAGRLKKMFDRARVTGKFNRGTKSQPVFQKRVRAEISGAELVLRGPGVADDITKFVAETVAKQQDLFEWVSRSE